MNETGESIIETTADIVAAHVSNNSVAVGDLPTLIANVHAALSGLGTATAAPASKAEPAVSVRSSVKPDAITCLVCGLKNKMLKRHIMAAHGMTPADYRIQYDLKADYPMVAPNYSEQRRALAHSIGLGTKGRSSRGRGGRPRKS